MKQIFYLIGIIFFSISYLKATEISASYAVSFGVLGELGEADASLRLNKDRYTITIEARTTGLAKLLSKNRQERHISKGTIQQGMFIADSYRVIRTQKGESSTLLYRIDHKTKKVLKQKVKKRDGNIYATSKERLDFYSPNDLLTLYFNLSQLMKNKPSGVYSFKAVGAERQNGQVEVRMPTKNARKLYEKALGKGEWLYLSATIYQKIFGSQKGELMLAIGQDGIAQNALLKDLILLGDLKARRTK
jgi:hypothetical protein